MIWDWFKDKIIRVGYSFGWTDYDTPKNYDLANRRRTENLYNWKNQSQNKASDSRNGKGDE